MVASEVKEFKLFLSISVSYLYPAYSRKNIEINFYGYFETFLVEYFGILNIYEIVVCEIFGCSLRWRISKNSV